LSALPVFERACCVCSALPCAPLLSEEGGPQPRAGLYTAAAARSFTVYYHGGDSIRSRQRCGRCTAPRWVGDRLAAPASGRGAGLHALSAPRERLHRPSALVPQHFDTITGAIVSTLAAFGGLPPVICWESGGDPRRETIGGSELCPAHPSPATSEQMQKVCARIANRLITSINHGLITINAV